MLVVILVIHIDGRYFLFSMTGTLSLLSNSYKTKQLQLRFTI